MSGRASRQAFSLPPSLPPPPVMLTICLLPLCSQLCMCEWKERETKTLTKSVCVCVYERERERERERVRQRELTLQYPHSPSLTVFVPLLPELWPETKAFLFLSRLQVALSLWVVKKTSTHNKSHVLFSTFLFSLFVSGSFTQVLPWGQEEVFVEIKNIIDVGREKYETYWGLSYY